MKNSVNNLVDFITEEDPTDAGVNQVNNLLDLVTKPGSAAIQTLANSSWQVGAVSTLNNSSNGQLSTPVNTMCYLEIIRPVWSNPTGYGDQFGYPSDIGGTINMSATSNFSDNRPFTGFLSVRSVKLDGISATLQEKSEIQQLMISGIILPDVDS
jgi:hypothetical protein